MGKIKHDIPDITVVVTKGDEYLTSVTPSQLYQVIVNTGDNYNVSIDDPEVITSEGSGSYIKVADYATYALTSSFAQTASYVSGAASDWTYITNKPSGLVSSSTQATGWTVLSASYAANVASITWNAVQNKPTGLVSSSTQIALNQVSGSTFKSASYVFPQDVLIKGMLSASELRVTRVVSASTTGISGSNIFGSSETDLQQFTGSVVFNNGATGSLNGTASFANNVNLSGVIGNETLATTGSNTFTGNQTISGSIVLTGGNVEFISTKVTDVFNQTKVVNPIISSLIYSGVNIEYTAQRSGEIRSGMIFSSWNGSAITYTDTSNVEIGEYNDLSFDFIRVGDDIRFRAYSLGLGSGAWTIQFLFKLFPNLL